MKVDRSHESSIDLGKKRRRIHAELLSRIDTGSDPRTCAAKVLLDALRVATRLMHERGGQLDQALDQLALGEVAGAHPRRLEQLVRLEEVVVRIGRKSRLEC